MRWLPILVLLFMTPALPALAGDGVLEINQTCAVNTGCFAGDTPGLPVTISATGSYRLTSNLDYPSATANAVTINASDVTIDLNGYTIKGTNTCTVGAEGWVTSCSQTNGVGQAIRFSAGLRHRVTNGRVIGANGGGISLGDSSEVRNVQVGDCFGNGIQVGSRSSVSSVSAIGNLGSGIASFTILLVRDSIAANNAGNGITAGQRSTVSGNTADQNGTGGISAGNGANVSGNTADQNGGDGIFCSEGCTVVENAAYDNGDVASSTFDDGITCTSGCIVRGNSVRSNGGYGLNLGTDSAYSDNVVTNNTTGTVAGAGSANSKGGNHCAGTGVGSASCP